MSIFEKSIELAKANFEPNHQTRVQVFSFAWYKNRIISIGRNQNKTHPLNLKNILVFDDGVSYPDKMICAELNLFLKLKRTNIAFNKITVCNVRIDKNGEVKNSKPCRSCESLLNFFSPKHIFFTNEKAEWSKYKY